MNPWFILFQNIAIVWVFGFLVHLAFCMKDVHLLIDYLKGRIENPKTDGEKTVSLKLQEVVEKHGDDYAYKMFVSGIVIVLLGISLIWPVSLYIYLKSKNGDF